jgi:Flp pilus assembly protein TadG
MTVKHLKRLLGRVQAAAYCRIRAMARDDAGAVSPLIVLAIVPLIGAFGMGTEVSNWYLTQRAAQNAADTAAIAAATTGANTTACTAAGDFCYEAKAAAAKGGFTNGANNTVVTPTYLTTGCPGTASTCYKVTVSRQLPLELVQLLGYRNTTIAGSGRMAQFIQATAIASAGKPVDFCILTLSTGNSSFRLNGAPNAFLPGCDLFSDGKMTCNGNSLPSSPYGYAVGTSNCGATPLGGQTSQPDPKTALNLNPPIPTNPCGSTYQQNSGAAITGSNVITSATNFASPVLICGNARVGSAAGGQTINVTNSNAVLVIYNGSLDMYGNTLETTAAGGLTIIFSGPSTGNTGGATTYSHAPIDSTNLLSGTIDIAAPTSGTLSGVAILQDARQNGNRDDNGNQGSPLNSLVYKGNNPTLKIQGLLYMPNADLDFRGAIDLHSNGLSCIGIVAKTLLVDGTASLLNNFSPLGDTYQCVAAGLTLPTVPGTTSRTGMALIQ